MRSRLALEANHFALDELAGGLAAIGNNVVEEGRHARRNTAVDNMLPVPYRSGGKYSLFSGYLSREAVRLIASSSASRHVSAHRGARQ